MISRTLTILYAASAILICASFALAATVTIIPSGGSSYTVQGADMNGVAGIELNITYDSSSLASPAVNQGALVSGSMFVANANNPGNIKVAIISTTPFKGSGSIAAITFGSQTGSGGITGVTASLININGGAIPVQASVAASSSQSPAAGTDTSDTTTTNTVTIAGGAASTAVAATVPVAVPVSSSLGSVSMPADSQQTGATAPVVAATPPQPAPVMVPETPAAVVETPPVPAAAVAPAVVSSAYTNIADRFRLYQGVKTPAAMAALFRLPIAGNIQQQPAIAVSDGKTNIRFLVDLSSGKATSPNFAMTGARMVSLKSAGAGKWIVEATPQKNSTKVSMAIVSGGSFVEYPVTVVPPIAPISSKEADFSAFLKDSGSKLPKYDLNSDSRHDYLDDYIYTAHYLIKNIKK